MHQLANTSTVRRFRLSAFLLAIKWLLVAVALGFLITAALVETWKPAMVSISFSAAAVAVGVVNWVVYQRARCPLCLIPPYSHRLCAKSPKARHFAGSYPLNVAFSVMFKGCFRCPYCGEPTELVVRQRPCQHRASPVREAP